MNKVPLFESEGKVIGHTKSKKPIYDTGWGDSSLHPKHKEFSKEEKQEAKLHNRVNSHIEYITSRNVAEYFEGLKLLGIKPAHKIADFNLEADAKELDKKFKDIKNQFKQALIDKGIILPSVGGSIMSMLKRVLPK